MPRSAAPNCGRRKEEPVPTAGDGETNPQTATLGSILELMASPANPSGALILVVDDEPITLRAATGALATAGFRVIVAENGVAGLEAFLAHADEIAMVVSDIVMPIMDGTTMAVEIKKARPEIRILLMTAYSDAIIDLMNETKFPLIRKPFLPVDLVLAVEAQLHPHSAKST